MIANEKSECSPDDGEAPWLRDWPAEELESVAACPACGDSRRSLLHKDLTDRVFRVAHGHWTLYHCEGCHSAYLDPCPTGKSIHLAYSRYFTHQVIAPTPISELSAFRRLRRTLVNGYCNWRFGTHYVPAASLGILAAWCLPQQRLALDLRYRFLPKRSGLRILDVGFGSGAFLREIATAGWEIAGAELDEHAVIAANIPSADLRWGGIEAFGDEAEKFDVITLSHVIEHVHNPRELIQRAYVLLRQGGTLYIDTPNLFSEGHTRMQRNWLHLDPPRHLVLFNPKALSDLVMACGFNRIERIKRNDVKPCAITDQVGRHQYGDAYGNLRIEKGPRWFRHVDQHEFITLFAHK